MPEKTKMVKTGQKGAKLKIEKKDFPKYYLQYHPHPHQNQGVLFRLSIFKATRSTSKVASKH